MARTPGTPRVVVFIQENKTTDYEFGSMRAFGADIAAGWPSGGPRPPFDPIHDRNAAAWRQMTRDGSAGATPFFGLRQQIDTDSVLPFYSYLAKTGTFFDHHFQEYATNSTPGHLVMVGGQTVTMTNPALIGTETERDFDLPTIFRLAERSGYTWGAFTDPTDYPAKFYRELNYDDAQPNLHQTADFEELAEREALPDLCFVWSRTGRDEHPPSDIRAGERQTWRFVDALVRSGQWNDTVCLLTYDDWGGFDDHVTPPAVETLVDAQHPRGYQVGYGPRIPLIMFGGHVRSGVDSRLFSQVSIPRTVQRLLDLPPMGVPRLDHAVDFADRYDVSVWQPEPPRFGERIVQPDPPLPTPPPQPAPPPPGPARPMDAVYFNGGVIGAAPSDGVVLSAPPSQPGFLAALWERIEVDVVAMVPPWLERFFGAPPTHHRGPAPPGHGGPSPHAGGARLEQGVREPESRAPELPGTLPRPMPGSSPGLRRPRGRGRPGVGG